MATLQEPVLNVNVKKWQKPQHSQIKFNWDHVVKVTENCSSFGGLARDGTSEVLAAFNSTFPSILTPNVAKSMALRKTMVLSRNLALPMHFLWEIVCRR